MDAARRQDERNARRAVVEAELARLSTEPRSTGLFTPAHGRGASWAVIAGELRALHPLTDPANDAALRMLSSLSRLVSALRGSDRPVSQAALGLVGEGLHDFDQLSNASSCTAEDDDLVAAMELLATEVGAHGPDAAFDARLEAFRPEPARSRRRAAAALAAEGAMRLEAVWSGLADYVRRQGEALGKRVELVATGGELEVSGRAGEALRPALLQLVRNACAHGVETPAARQGAGKPGLAILRLSARRSGDRVEVTLADDGRGVDAGRTHGAPDFAEASGYARASAFAGGLDPSTAAAEPSPEHSDPHGLNSPALAETAPRAGLDLVRGAVEEVGGQVALSSTPGRGAAFTLTLPAPPKAPQTHVASRAHSARSAA